MKHLLAAMFLMLAACGQTPSADNVALATNGDGPTRAELMANRILDPAAPTVADLRRRGLDRVDDEPMGWSCGPDCIADGFIAIYMGRETRRGPERLFICPVGEGDMETWRCRDVEIGARYPEPPPPQT
ncbi:MAG TPA: hypothetical protein VIT38_02925 [Allosphingosinicella sp.]